MPRPDRTNAERQRRWRERRRIANDPVHRFLRAVIPWAEAHGTPGAARMALAASLMIDLVERGPAAEDKNAAELMGVWTRPAGRTAYTATDASRIALGGLERAQRDLESGATSERSVSAGLAMAKHLLAQPKRRGGRDDALMAMWRATAGGPPPPHLVHDDTLSPEDFRDPADGESAARRTSE